MEGLEDPLYERLWIYYNLFQPVMHLTGKEIVGGRLHRKWDRAQTPYQRLLASGIISPEQKRRLAELHAQTNPRQLRQDIYQAVEQLWSHPLNKVNQRKEAALAR